MGCETVCVVVSVVFMGAYVTDLVSADLLPDNRGLHRVRISALRKVTNSSLNNIMLLHFHSFTK